MSYVNGMRWLIIFTFATLAYGADIIVFGTSLSDDGHGITPIIRDKLNKSVLVRTSIPFVTGSRSFLR